MRTVKFFAFLIIICSVPVFELNAQGLLFSTRIKTEYQYTDYFKYGYPDPVYFEYPETEYTQLKPYIAEFPEHRFLVRAVQRFDHRTALTLKYQHSGLDIESDQNIYAFNLGRNVTDNFSLNGGAQYTQQKNQVNGMMYEAGFRYGFAGFTIIQPGFKYYKNDDLSEDQNKGSAYSADILVRQALSEVSAVQFKYIYFKSSGDITDFYSNTIVGWYSRYFETETAVHVSFRHHWNSEDIKTYAAELETVQYLNWASVIRFIYRYYTNKGTSQLNYVYKDKRLKSHSASAVLEYLLLHDLTLSAKYRYYISNQDTKMNTYMLGLERLF